MGLPEVAAVFRTPDELVKALHYKWSQLVIAHMDYAVFEGDVEPVEAKRQAEATAARDEPMLRELLLANESSDSTRSRWFENRCLALAGDPAVKPATA